MAQLFQIRKHSRVDKSITVDGPGDLRFYVDYDDVNHSEVLRDLRELVRLANERPAWDWWGSR